MHRFHQNEEISVGSTIELDGQQAHQINRVLRTKVGDKLVVFNTTDYLCEITGISKKSATLKVLEPIENKAERPIKVHLYQALPNRWPKFEEVLKKGTEMGVASFHPVKMHRSETTKLQKEERLHHIIVEACEQCGGSHLPPISGPVDFKEAVKEAPGLKIMAYEGEPTRKLSDIDIPDEISIFIGPEGGITPEEAEFFEEQGGYCFHLGKRILRTETAPVAILGAVFFGL